MKSREGRVAAANNGLRKRKAQVGVSIKQWLQEVMHREQRHAGTASELGSGPTGLYKYVALAAKRRHSSSS